jgi:transcriptional regulator with XRE-family HTH domain
MPTSTKTRDTASSTSSRSAKKRMRRTRAIPRRLGVSGETLALDVVASNDSDSRLDELYRSDQFALDRDNDIAYQLGRNALYLRRLRKRSQADIAKAMKTSQPAVARIEGGDENITLLTLKKLALALNGRIRFAIEPEEESYPRVPPWWELEPGATASSTWTLRASKSIRIGGTRHLGAWWTVEQGTTTPRARYALVAPALAG